MADLQHMPQLLVESDFKQLLPPRPHSTCDSHTGASGAGDVLVRGQQCLQPQDLSHTRVRTGSHRPQSLMSWFIQLHIFSCFKKLHFCGLQYFN